MDITEKILAYQIDRGIFEDAPFHGTKGIASLAVEKGFDTLSTKQKTVLAPYLSKKCSGVTDPGGHRANCTTVLEEQALLDAYHRCDDIESLVCDACESEAGYYAHQWDKLSEQ